MKRKPQKIIAVLTAAEPPLAKCVHRKPTIEDASRRVLKELNFIEDLKAISCLPERLWPVEAKRILARDPDLKREYPDPIKILNFYELDMKMHRMRLGRTVQPTGDDQLHDLAPIIGALRLESMGVEFALPSARYAQTYLLKEFLLAVHDSDSKKLEDIVKFSNETRTTHINRTLWDVIFQWVQENKKPVGDYEYEIQVSTWKMPDSQDIRSFVLREKSSGRLLNFPTAESSWSKLWTQSGARDFIQMASRGPEH